MISNFQLGFPSTWKSLYKTCIIFLTLEVFQRKVEEKNGVLNGFLRFDRGWHKKNEAKLNKVIETYSCE